MEPIAANQIRLLSKKISGSFPPDVPFVQFGTWGDGTCFFHSVCAALNYKNYLHASSNQQKTIGRTYRCEFAKKITDRVWNQFQAKHSGVVKMATEQVRRNFCNFRFWANQEMIMFVSELLGLNILFVDVDESKMYCGVHGSSDQPMIVILWLNKSHFEPVGACRAVSDDGTLVQFKFDPAQDREIVDFILNSFNAQCPAA